MSMEPWEADEQTALQNLYNEFGPEWAAEHRDELFQQAVREFTSDRLKSYYVAQPRLALPALDSLKESQSLLASHPKAALVFAMTAIEVTIKTVLLKPIVFGLVHTEAVAELVTELTIGHTGMERFQALLTEILNRVAGVDLSKLSRTDSRRTLWEEVKAIQKIRNEVLHRGELHDSSSPQLAVEVAGTLLEQIFPHVLQKLGLHLHDPGVVCAETHSVDLAVTFTIPNPIRGTRLATINVDLPEFDPVNPPNAMRGRVLTYIDAEDLDSMRSTPAKAFMQVVSLPVKYQVQFETSSSEFTAKGVPWE